MVPVPAAHTAGDAAQDTESFWAGLAHLYLLINSLASVLLPVVVLNPFPAQPGPVLGIAPNQVHLALSLDELHEVPKFSPLHPAHSLFMVSFLSSV